MTPAENLPESDGGMQSYIEAALCLESLNHDINNHLGAIYAFAELIGLESEGAPDIQSRVAAIISSVRKSTDLLDTLASSVRPDQTIATNTDVCEVLQHVVDLFQHEMRKAGIDLSLEINGDCSPITAIRARLIRAFIAIMRDTVERVRHASNKEIHVQLEGSPDAITIQIKDSGENPPDLDSGPETSPRYTARPDLVIRSALSEARRLIRSHAGDMTYDSDSGLTLRLPRRNGLGISTAIRHATSSGRG